jgi:hypothetical protein
MLTGAGAAAAMTFANTALAAWEPSTRYPDPAVQVLDPSFGKYRLPLASVERLSTGFRWAEGPVYFGDARCLLWSDIPTIASCAGTRRRGARASIAAPPTTPMATRAIAKAVSSPPNMDGA